MEEFVYYNNLFDIYGSLLTDKEQITFKDYYQEDLSLAEIANEKNISRSAVSKTIKNVIEKLNYYEERLHLYNNIYLKLNKVIELNSIEKIKKEIEEILNY